MASSKDILVLTTSSCDGLKIKKHLKPVSAHLVAGTNLFSDFMGGLTDVFGGRSNSYQKQLSSLYNEAIEMIKHNTYEIGGNCVLGLSIDMDEISGKGKSMFMLTAIGTAVVIEKDVKLNSISQTSEKLENVGVERINNLRRKKIIIERAENKSLDYDDDVWDFITSNQVFEIFPFLIKSYANLIVNFQERMEIYNKFHQNLIRYIDALEESKKISLLYESVENEPNKEIAFYLTKVIKELNLYDYDRNLALLKNPDFIKQKAGVRIAIYDKPFYDKTDIENLIILKNLIATMFTERGEITSKKQLLSSKEREVWNCECGNNSIGIDSYCSNCNNDIYGFNQTEIRPNAVVNHIEEKIELIKEFIV